MNKKSTKKHTFKLGDKVSWGKFPGLHFTIEILYDDSALIGYSDEFYYAVFFDELSLS